MVDLPDYEDRRREAERLSKLARTPAERDDFLKIAEIWRRLAEEPPTGPEGLGAAPPAGAVSGRGCGGPASVRDRDPPGRRPATGLREPAKAGE